MKAILRTVNDRGKIYEALLFVCPGCVMGGRNDASGLHMLPVNATEDIHKPSWDWDGNLEAPTLSPSILTRGSVGVCHSYLENGKFRFLEDCTHPLVGMTDVEMPDIPEWITHQDN